MTTHRHVFSERQALNVNAYRQRVKVTRTLAFDPEEARAPGQRLRIAIRSDLPKDDDDDDDATFVMGVPKMSDPLEIPTKAQSIEHLEALARGYDEWLEAHQGQSEIVTATFKFEKRVVKVEEDDDDEDDDDDDEDEDDEDDDDDSDDDDDNRDDDEDDGNGNEDERDQNEGSDDVDAVGSDDEGPPPSEVLGDDDGTQVGRYSDFSHYEADISFCRRSSTHIWKTPYCMKISLLMRQASFFRPLHQTSLPSSQHRKVCIVL